MWNLSSIGIKIFFLTYLQKIKCNNLFILNKYFILKNVLLVCVHLFIYDKNFNSISGFQVKQNENVNVQKSALMGTS